MNDYYVQQIQFTIHCIIKYLIEQCDANLLGRNHSQNIHTSHIHIHTHLSHTFRNEWRSSLARATGPAESEAQILDRRAHVVCMPSAMCSYVVAD